MKRILILFLWAATATLSAADSYQRNGFTVVPRIAGSTPTTGSTINGRAGVSAVNGSTVVVDSETSTWITRIVAINAPSQPNTRSVWIATNLARQLLAASYSAKVVWLMPFLGSDLTSARVPIRDSLAKGAATFTGLSYSEGSGLTSNGINQWFDSLIKPSELGASNSGGMGVWVISAPDNTGTAGGTFAGYTTTANASYFSILGLPTINGLFTWGAPANGTSYSATAATTGNFYGERSSSTSRQLFKNGSSIGTNTTSDTASQAADYTIHFLGLNTIGSGTSYKGIIGYAALTDGTLGPTDASAFHTLISNYLIAPSGR